MSRIRRSILTSLAMFGVLAGGLLLAAAPALAVAPEAPVTEAPTANTTGTTATLNGELNPGLAAEKVMYRFAYSAGSTAACTESGLTAPDEPFPEAEGNHEKVSTPVTGLVGGSEYTVCLIAANPAEPAESTQGNSVKFKTPAAAPEVPAASQVSYGVTPFDAVLEARVNPERQQTTDHFEYAASEEALLKGEGVSIGEASLAGVSEPLTAGPVDIGGGLTEATAYFWRVVASNATGTTDGAPQTFTTLAAERPLIDGESSGEVTQTGAHLHALINPNYQATRYQFML